MKRLFILVIFIVVILTGCASATNNNKDDITTESYDSTTLKIAAKATTESGFDFASNPFTDGLRYFNVTKKSDKEFLVNVNGEKIIVQIPKDESSTEYVPSNVSDVSSKIVESSKNLVCQYIDSSNVLKDKDKIKEYIENLAAKEGNFTDDDDVGAYFSYADNCIYINRYNSDIVCEWMIVHELIHAVSFYTHGCSIEKEEYAFNLFNEILTDIFTSSLNPHITKDVESGYVMYYNLVYPYINLFGEKAIYDYFYGYNDIYNHIEKDEFEFFVLIIENYGVENTDVFYNNMIYKWYR